jgi:hypothetical protein
MQFVFAPLTAWFILIAISAYVGIAPIKKLIQIQEAKHDLKHGSAGFLRSTLGWIIIAFWFAGTWFFATIIGDWYTTDDLPGAIARSRHRLELMLRILAALADD